MLPGQVPVGDATPGWYDAVMTSYRSGHRASPELSDDVLVVPLAVPFAVPFAGPFAVPFAVGIVDGPALSDRLARGPRDLFAGPVVVDHRSRPAEWRGSGPE